MTTINHVPSLNMKSSTTGCCPIFDPKSWDNLTLKFENKLFVKASTRSFLHIPLNMGSVMTKTSAAIDAAGAKDENEYIVLSDEVSAWKADHYFAVAKEVPGLENVKLTGSYLTKVFEGQFKDAAKWHAQLAAEVKAAGKTASKLYFYYTTCPKCAKVYGKNYVVGVAKVG